MYNLYIILELCLVLIIYNLLNEVFIKISFSSTNLYISFFKKKRYNCILLVHTEAQVVKMHLDEFEQNEENIKQEIFSNENTSLNNYGAIYKDQNSDKFILSDKKIEGKVLLAECNFHKIINNKGYINPYIDGIKFP